MGRDKLALCRGHEQWWARQARILQASGASTVLLSRRAGQPSPEGILCIQDFYTDIGPMAGLHAALARPSAHLLAVLAVDMPLLKPNWFCGLLAHCDSSCGALYSQGDFLEPLAALYPACALPVVESQLHQGRLSLQALARRLASQGLLRVLPLPAALLAQASSFNTPQSLDVLQS